MTARATDTNRFISVLLGIPAVTSSARLFFSPAVCGESQVNCVGFVLGMLKSRFHRKTQCWIQSIIEFLKETVSVAMIP